MILRKLTPAEGEPFYNEHLKRDFPDSELKPWWIMLEHLDRGMYDLLAAFDGDRLVGYAWQFCPPQGAILIDYLAIVPELRGQGWGTALLDALRQYYAPTGQMLVLESEHPEEAPDPEEAKRRLAFYFRAGLQDTGVETRLFGVRFCILSFGELDDPRQAIWDVYRTMLDDERFERFFQLLPEDRISRIQTMEAILDHGNKLLSALPASRKELEAMAPEIDRLIAYYESEAWMDDYEADQRGELPRDLKRGVLSQDAVFDFLTEYKG